MMRICRKLTFLILLSISAMLVFCPAVYAADVSVAGDTQADTLSLTPVDPKPGTAASGEIVYDAAADELYLWTYDWYGPGSWLSIGGTNQHIATKIVAAANSLDPSRADSQCTGTSATGGDEVTIQAAITDITNNPYGFTKGALYLLDGTYWTSGWIEAMGGHSIIGTGAGTVISPKNSASGFISPNDGLLGQDCRTRTFFTNLRLDGNKANNSNLISGIIFPDQGYFCKINKLWIENCTNHGIEVSTSSINGIISGNTIASNDGSGIDFQNNCRNNIICTSHLRDNGSHGIDLSALDYNNIICSNISQDNAGNGIRIRALSSYNTVYSNTVQGNNSSGISSDGVNSSDNYISGNIIQSNDLHGIYFTGSDNNIVSGNIIQSNKQHGIYFNSADNNIISGNIIKGNDVDDTASYDGIYLLGTVYNNLVSFNLFADNDRYAINVYDANGDTYNYLAGNYVVGTDHEAGIYDDTQAGTTIHTSKDKITLGPVTVATRWISSLGKSPETSYVRSGRTANLHSLSPGKAAGDILILEGPSTGGVTLEENVTAQLCTASHLLQANDTIALIYNGTVWVELSHTDN